MRRPPVRLPIPIWRILKIPFRGIRSDALEPRMHSHEHSHEAAAADRAGMATDPVCGMTVDPAKTPHHAEHAGRVFHFCGAGCRAKFLADPERYLAPKLAAAPPTDPGAIYTCPMHPEIRQIGPGSCPICGMALEHATVSAETGPS